MVKIRLRRTGAKKAPNYRVVVTDSRSPRDGRFIEIIGHYNPRMEPKMVKVHEDRAIHWLSVGAQPTDIVRKLLTNVGTYEKFEQVKAGRPIEEVLSQEADNGDVSSAPSDAIEVETKPSPAEETVSQAEVAATEETANETLSPAGQTIVATADEVEPGESTPDNQPKTI